MPFVAECLFCGQKVKVPDHALGTSGRCPKCHDFFTLVPAEEVVVPDKGGPYARIFSKSVTPRPASGEMDARPGLAFESGPANTALGPGLAEEGPPVRPWIEPFALGALLLVGGALLCASTHALGMMVIWLSILAFLAGLVSLLRVLIVGQFRLLFPVAGALLAFGVLYCAFLFPGLLGPTYLASREKDKMDSTAIRTVPLRGGSVNEKVNSAWVDARRWALLQGSQRVQVNKAWVGPLAPGAKTKKDEKDETYLFIQVNIHQVVSHGEFSSQMRESGLDHGSFRPRLMDATGKVYTVRVAGAEGTLENVRKSELFPVAVRDHVLIFAAPASGLDLRLEISAKGDQFFRFQIPAAMIQKANLPGLAGN